MDGIEDILFQLLAAVCTETKQSFDQHIGMSQARRRLIALVAQENEVSHAALQQRLSLDGATITRLVKQFEAEGILRRRLDPADNRYTLITLTVSGQHLAARLKGDHSQFQTRLLAGITREEQEMVARALERLRSNIRAIREAEREQT